MTTTISLEFGGAPNMTGTGRGGTKEWIRIFGVILSNVEGFTEQPGTWAKIKKYPKLSSARAIAKDLTDFRAWAENPVNAELDDETGAWEFYAERLADGPAGTVPGQLWVRYNPEPKRP